ncbi:restriction endonuclease [Lacipirellula parvula]|uniref:Restriction endonuclease type IV Mrr domain-containing protein n=1 Tax=Lacipirellula parvula TaxID=2650471 RepID=A0A5K7XLM2_9BACT|nr:restriction endonuclease [Lacipirellula parvula]BBO36241.1 hypothetical protein PLANPX_5853 [Lacipirellula parvula]
MKEDLFALIGGRLEKVCTRDVPAYERDPSKTWIGSSPWHLDLKSFTLTHEREHISTAFSVDPSVLFHTQIVELGPRTLEGRRVQTPTATWFEISNHLYHNPHFRFEFCTSPEKLEHFIAASHWLDGCETVVVTPRSNDKGRDVIAENKWTRILHEAKAYNPNRRVKAEQVRALWGVFSRDKDATCAAITTTADFAPGVHDEFHDLLSNELHLFNGEDFAKHINRITTTISAASLSRRLFSEAGGQISCVQGRVLPKRKQLTFEQFKQLRDG